MAEQKKPNILIIWGDDVGITNLSCYSDGLMGYRTPNIDRIASEGMRFTDYYGQQSCTAGRAAFITGQSPYRTGLTKVGMPGADIGLQAEFAQHGKGHLPVNHVVLGKQNASGESSRLALFGADGLGDGMLRYQRFVRVVAGMDA